MTQHKLFDWLTLMAYCSLIFWLSNQERLPMPVVFDFQDKLLHFAAYFVMGIFSWRAFRHCGWTARRLTLLSVVFCSLYGLSDEWHQSFVPGRTPSALDWLADTLGAILAMGIMLGYKLRNRCADDLKIN